VLEIALAGVLALIAGAALGLLIQSRRRSAGASRGIAEAEQAADALRTEAERTVATARREAETILREAEVEARTAALEMERATERALQERETDLTRKEERIQAREEELERRDAGQRERERSLDERERTSGEMEQALRENERAVERKREEIAGLTADEARTLVLAEAEERARHESALLARRIEEEARQDADRRAREIVATSIQRTASSQAAATTVTTVALASDDLKGRIIGREGRNIRAFETTTGVDVIIDDTPGMVALSSFDGVRRETARLALERLVADGRIHPARIEEAFYAAKADVEEQIAAAGEQASFEANVPGLDPELLTVLGRLNYRTSYGQNVLRHSLECAHLAAIMAVELGADERVARRAALLHDIGKAVTHEVEGPHAVISADLCRRHGESEAVVHAVEAHHHDVEPNSVEAVLVIAADAVSAARPGARGESLEQYVKRLEALEEIATRHEGVERCFAMQAGRDVRVIVKPDEVDDATAALLARDIAREIEDSLDYPGQIKVTVIRESRTSEIAH
jgi:ribonuclease Y